MREGERQRQQPVVVTAIQTAKRHVERVLRYCCVLLILALVALVFVQVVFRFVFRAPFDWAEELARYFFTWVSVLGAVLAVDARAHFHVDIVPNLLDRRHRHWLDLVLRVAAFVFLAVVVVVSVRLVRVMGTQSSPVLELPLSYLAVALPIGLSGMCLFLLFGGLFQEPDAERGND
jgi:TRAP-type transport system small permease protein